MACPPPMDPRYGPHLPEVFETTRALCQEAGLIAQTL